MQTLTFVRPTGLALLATFTLTACSGLLEADRPPEQTWWLEPLAAHAAGPDPTAAALTLQMRAVPGLDTNLVLTLNDQARLNHFAGARWTDHAPDLLASVLTRSLENSGKFASVQVRHAPPANGCHLVLELRRFFSHVDMNNIATSVEVEMAGQFSCGDDSKQVQARASGPVSGSVMPDVIAAFQRNLDKATKDLENQLGSGS